MNIQKPSFTFGIEEEYHLVDIKTRRLAQAPTDLMDACRRAIGEQVSPEFFRSQIEIGTKVCQTFTEGREEISRLRAAIAKEAKKFGLAPIAASTHPFAPKSDLVTTEKERYQELARDFAGIGRRLAICGMHTHVAIEDPELRIDLMNQARYFLPHLLMYSSSSPFWQGDDTGLKSYRLAVFHSLPRTGLPQQFESFGAYQRTIDVLIAGGVIEDASKVWWDLRPSNRFPTLEQRVTDVATRIDDVMSIVALYVCLLRMLYRLRTSNLSWRKYPAFLISENLWRAQRYSVGDTLFDLGSGTLVPFRELTDELIHLVSEDADALGCRSEIQHLAAIAKDGTSADRQTATYNNTIAAGGSAQAALDAVVDQLIAETVDNI